VTRAPVTLSASLRLWGPSHLQAGVYTARSPYRPAEDPPATRGHIVLNGEGAAGTEVRLVADSAQAVRDLADALLWVAARMDAQAAAGVEADERAVFGPSVVPADPDVPPLIASAPVSPQTTPDCGNAAGAEAPNPAPAKEGTR